MDKIIEIARYLEPGEVDTLRSLLEAEGIPFFLKDEISNQVLGYANIGGIKLEVLEKDAPRVMEIMKEGGYPVETGGEPAQLKAISSFADRIPLIKNLPLEKQIVILFVVTAVLLALLIYAGSILSTH